jgi:hypothetical protein
LGTGTGVHFLHFPLNPVLIYFGGRGGEWFPFLFHLPIIPLGAVFVPVLCVIYYYLIYDSKSNENKKEREKRKMKEKKKNRGPKISTERDCRLTNNEQNKQLETKRKKK